MYLAAAEGEPRGGDDAADAVAFTADEIPADLVFDHHRILADFLVYRHRGERPQTTHAVDRSLTDVERATLVGIARSAIGTTLGLVHADPPRRTERLNEIGAAFVSLHRGGELRGCIGNLAFDRPLEEVVRDVAVAAAFEDPRFPPVAVDEYPTVEVQLSVLTRPRRMPPELIVAGLHGVCLTVRGHKAVFLPQVAREEGWCRRTLLEQLSLKAGLEADAWADADAELETFTSEIASDRD